MFTKVVRPIIAMVLCALMLLSLISCECKHKKTYSETLEVATCTEKGLGITKCTKCDVELDRYTIMPSGHNTYWETAQKVTCATNGLEVKKCTTCNEIVERETIPAEGHDYRSNICKICSHYEFSDITITYGGELPATFTRTHSTGRIYQQTKITSVQLKKDGHNCYLVISGTCEYIYSFSCIYLNYRLYDAKGNIVKSGTVSSSNQYASGDTLTQCNFDIITYLDDLQHGATYRLVFFSE